MQIKILLVDDDDSLRRVLAFKLKSKSYTVTEANSADVALAELGRDKFDLLLTDMRMPGMSGLELLDRVRVSNQDLQVIMITAHATISQAVEAVKLGAFDYLTKPFDDEQLFVAIEKALRVRELSDENRRLRCKLQEQNYLSALVGVSSAFKKTLETARRIAGSDATALITGESGSGKEVIARVIHNASDRSDRAFVAVNCAAIPGELMESELFGHHKGAFTGAVRDKRGKFDLADGGTLFLDEISELSQPLQAKLLRVLQERVIEPLGAESGHAVDIRVIAATNVNLQEFVRMAKFREDLFYRLNVIPIHVPSLRERPDDIEPLTRHFISKYARGQNIEIDPGLIVRLKERKWPGNVRELENLIERIIALRSSNRLSVVDLPKMDSDSAHSETDADSGEPIKMRDAEKKMIVAALDRCGGNKSQAARALGIPRHVLLYRIKKYDIPTDMPA